MLFKSYNNYPNNLYVPIDIIEYITNADNQELSLIFDYFNKEIGMSICEYMMSQPNALDILKALEIKLGDCIYNRIDFHGKSILHFIYKYFEPEMLEIIFSEDSDDFMYFKSNAAKLSKRPDDKHIYPISYLATKIKNIDNSLKERIFSYVKSDIKELNERLDFSNINLKNMLNQKLKLALEFAIKKL